MVRQQAIHPGERRKLLRGFEENEVYLSYGEHEQAQKEAARVARVEASRKPLLRRDPDVETRDAKNQRVIVQGAVHHDSIAQVQEQVQKMGFDQTVVEGERAIGGLLDGITILEPRSLTPPPVRSSPTLMDEQEAARARRRRQDEAPPPQLGSDAYTQELAAAGMADATVVVAAAPQPQPAAAAPQPHVGKASKLSPATFADLLRKKFGM